MNRILILTALACSALADGHAAPLAVFRAPSAELAVTADDIARAEPMFDQIGQPALSIRFRSEAARAFGDLTAQAVGQQMAFEVCGDEVSTPVIREPIRGGQVQLSGMDLAGVVGLADILSGRIGCDGEEVPRGRRR